MMDTAAITVAITPELKRAVALRVMKEYGRHSGSTDVQIELITNLVFNGLARLQKTGGSE